jgi:hypothetical protein
METAALPRLLLEYVLVVSVIRTFIFARRYGSPTVVRAPMTALQLAASSEKNQMPGPLGP